MGDPSDKDYMLFINQMKKNIKLYLSHIFNDFNVFTFAYSIMNKDDGHPVFMISDHPTGWLTQYRNYGYQKIDPVIIIACRKFTPFSQQNNPNMPDQNFYKMSSDYALDNGYTFTLHDPDKNLATLTISQVKQNAVFYDIIEKEKNNFQMLLITTHEKVIRFFDARKEQGGGPEEEPCRLSPREKEVLFWAIVGKTYNEISTILSIREGTVKFHIRNIISKLGVANAKHAITWPMELKLLS
ncbi:MAG: LuxR family transcriptional regulator [Sodalis sp. (in: enterobacteria)]|uniref:LuxR family transcriptional regulator n=1 Tax=Sodalis sp. (in: enterobacteria) TaxID=1898979 RepID=UPI003F348233